MRASDLAIMDHGRRSRWRRLIQDLAIGSLNSNAPQQPHEKLLDLYGLNPATPASVRSFWRAPDRRLACESSHPPTCFPPTNTLGT